MRLERFRVTNFRSVNDSGWINVTDTTAFIGRNECGKTNLLQALASLNDAVVPEPLSRTRDFPADRLHSDYSDAIDVVRTTWSLSDDERASLAELVPEAREVTQVEVGRGYTSERWVRFVGMVEAEQPSESVGELLKRVEAVPSEPGALPDPGWALALATLTTAVERRCEDRRAWANEVGRAMAGLQGPIQRGTMLLGEDSRAALEEISDRTMQIASEPELENAARDWVLRRMPRFLYLDQYPDIDGQQNLAEFAARQAEGRSEPADPYFRMLLRVSGIDPDRVQEILDEEPEVRRQIASRAGSALTRTMRQIWTDRALKVRFNLDGDHFNTLVSDPTSMCDIEVNLNQRSRGFRWFFSFYVMFAAGQKDGSTSHALLLLDEPGLHLHSSGQQDLLRHLSEGLDNQVIFATQSPFMLPAGEDAAVRLIESTEDTGTVVSEQEVAASAVLEPAAAESESEESDASDEEIHEAVLVSEEASEEAELGPVPTLDSRPALLLESITDYWYLLVASDYLESQHRTSIPKELALTPIGMGLRSSPLRQQLGCGSGEVFALTSERPDPAEEDASDLIWIGDGLESTDASRVDVEDLLDPRRYDKFVRFAYRQEIGDLELELDPEVPCIVERYERALAAQDINFRPTRTARLILKGAFKNPEAVMNNASADRFERLLEAILTRYC